MGLIQYYKLKFILYSDFLSFYLMFFSFFFFKGSYLFIDRGEGSEKEMERNINVWLPLVRPLLRTWPTTQVCALIGNWTGDPLVQRPEFKPLSHTRQHQCSFSFPGSHLGYCVTFWCDASPGFSAQVPHFPCYRWPWLFRGGLFRDFVGCPSKGFAAVLFGIRLVVFLLV